LLIFTVLINNAGIALFPDTTLSSIQEAYSTVLATNVTSVAVITNAFLPLLHASTGRPKVINITSGLASITRAKQWKMLRAPAYASSKIGLNGLTVYMQLEEDERAEKEAAAIGGRAGKGGGNARVSFYCANPGLLKTALTNFMPMAKDPKDGAEVVVRLALEVGGPFEEAAIWEFEQGRMKQVPW
jgi:NAD(P)-dependent dehydrogenase (short-subunit alcohol dehydrogenase family)